MTIKPFLLILILATSAFAANSPGIFEIPACDSVRYQDFFGRLKEKIETQPFIPEFPYKIKTSFGIISDQKELVINTGTSLSSTYADYDHVQLFGLANVKDGKISLAHLSNPKDTRGLRDQVLDDYQYYRRSNMEYLQQQYKEWGFPEITWHSLQLQEHMLSEHRRFEYAVSKAGKLLFFARLYLGTHWSKIRGEVAPFQGDVPYTETFMKSGPFFYRRRIPTFFLPSDLIQMDPYAESNPLHALRADPNKSIVEFGRVFVDKEAPKEDILAARRLGFSMIANHLPDFAPKRDLTQLTVVATGGPAGAHLYDREFSLKAVADLTPLLGGNALGPLYDVLGRSYSNPVSDASLVPEYVIGSPRPIRPGNSDELKGITLLATTGDRLAAKLLENQLVDSSFDLDTLKQVVGGVRTEYVKSTKPEGNAGWRYR